MSDTKDQISELHGLVELLHHAAIQAEAGNWTATAAMLQEQIKPRINKVLDFAWHQYHRSGTDQL